MTTPAPDAPIVRRIDRILAFMAISLVALSIVCFLVVALGRPFGYLTDPSDGAWPLLIVFPLIALPIGFLLIATLLIMSFVRRRRENQA